MKIGEAVFLGALQGLTEFLPVSSSGHLAVAQKLFGVEEPALFFDTCLHIGTLFAVFIVLRREIWALVKKPFQKTSALLILATLVTACFAIGFKLFPADDSGLPLLEWVFTSPLFLSCAFLSTSLILLTAELLARRSTRFGMPPRLEADINWKDALCIGALQGLGVLPGISRSGSTLAAALGRKIQREFAARFSFLLSIPAVLGALALQVKDLVKDGEQAISIDWTPVLAGTITAALVGFFSIRFMLGLVRRRPLYVFSIWTAALGLGILFDVVFIHHFF